MHLHTFVNALQIRKSIIDKKLDPRWLKYMPGWQEIPNEIQASRELYKNLFEAPIVFFNLLLMCIHFESCIYLEFIFCVDICYLKSVALFC